MEVTPGLIKTVDDAVSRMISDMTFRDRILLAKMPHEDLPDIHISLGHWIMQHYRLGLGNPDLLESCRASAGNYFLTAGDAALVIIEALWEKLKDTHRLRAVK